ncbi:HAMP domain-containing histidine kinase [Candidatus Saccharibacteria bacterium]|nr:HAMP domain-containing histidine kinase [Candidatus Saccharibacteria bacterium]MCB9834753.1 HAMP domain-containing histidine kinase [Candidatus Nomurabacteria bacterium]
MLLPSEDFKTLASLVQQIKDPITNSQIYLSELAKTKLDPNQTELVSDITNLTTKLDRTFDIILSLSGLDENYKLINNAIQTRLLIDQLISDLGQFGKVQYQRKQALPSIAGNYLKLYQALLTIAKRVIDNASDKRITIDSSKKSNHILIRLIDQGNPYTKTTRRVLSSPHYFRLDFELALALEIIRLNGGQIRLTRFDHKNYLNIKLPTQTQAKLVKSND